MEDSAERRQTKDNLEFAQKVAKKKGAYYKGSSLFDLAPKVPQKPLVHMTSTYELSAEEVQELNEMEHWHFLSVQIWIWTIGNIVMSLF